MLGEFTIDETKPIVDGFLYSGSLVYLPTTYRASVMAQMEILRRARGYRTRWYIAPTDLQQPIAAYSQVEYQVGLLTGSYVWGLSFSAYYTADLTNAADQMHIQITDACTETPFFSDYVQGPNLQPVTGPGLRHPLLINPRLVGDPGLLNVEIYNKSNATVQAQLAMYVAEPSIPNKDLEDLLVEMGVAIKG